MASKKTEIIEKLFNARWEPNTRTISGPVVTLDQVADAIRAYNAANPGARLSDRNPANFFKDFIRKKKSANENWPTSVFARGYGARQITGGGLCFEFVRLPTDQVLPFPSIVVPPPTQQTPRHRIESASLPLASRRLGRSDEPWLAQVLVRLRVIETHLALCSKWDVLQVDHLQMSVKLGKTEIDALYLALLKLDLQEMQEAIVTCETKGLSDDILEDQVLSQVRATFGMPGVDQDLVIPMAVKARGPSSLHVVEFEAVTRDEALTTASLRVSTEAVYEFVPPVQGIGI